MCYLSGCLSRYKERRNKNLTDSLLGRKDACSKYNYEVMCNLLQDIVNSYNYVGTDYIGAGVEQHVRRAREES